MQKHPNQRRRGRPKKHGGLPSLAMNLMSIVKSSNEPCVPSPSCINIQTTSAQPVGKNVHGLVDGYSNTSFIKHGKKKVMVYLYSIIFSI